MVFKKRKEKNIPLCMKAKRSIHSISRVKTSDIVVCWNALETVIILKNAELTIDVSTLTVTVKKIKNFKKQNFPLIKLIIALYIKK